MSKYKLTFKEINGKYYYMIKVPTPGDKYFEDVIEHSMIRIMDFLENISDTYRNLCE